MGVKIESLKLGYINIQSTHGPSGKTLTTDAPVDNGGQGSSFSPTDLLATAYLSCMLTIIDLKTKALGFETKSQGNVEKVMGNNPRKISELNIAISLSKDFPAEQREQIEKAARNCPVALSVSSDLSTNITFNYDL